MSEIIEIQQPQSFIISAVALKRRMPAATWKAAREIAASAPGSDLFDFFEDWERVGSYDLQNEATIAAVKAFASKELPEDVRLADHQLDAILLPPCWPFERPA